MKTNDTKQTPAWEISKHGNGYKIEICDGGRIVCTVAGTSGTASETQAVASLVVVAPELLAALENDLAENDYTVKSMALGHTVSISSLQNCSAAIRAVIIKAKGGAK